MNNILFCLSVLSVIFLDTNLSYKLGLGNQRLLSSYLPMILFLLINTTVITKVNYNLKKYAIRIIFIGIFGFVFKLSCGQAIVFPRYFTLFFLPYLFSIYLEQAKAAELRIIRNILILFLIVQSSIALYERLTYTTLLASEDDFFVMVEGQNWTFRASGLLGHPLANAMSISTLLAFVMCSSMKFPKKLLLVLIAYIALLCFNERGYILISTFVLIVYLGGTYNKLLRKEKMFIWMICIPAVIWLFSYLQTSDWGGRLFNTESASSDHNAQVRLLALSAFSYLDFGQLVVGSPTNYEYVLNKMALAGIENGVVSIILYHGLLIGVIALVFWGIFQFNKLQDFGKLQKYLILIAFYGIGITNPHLTNPYQWMIFLLSIYSFKPSKVK